MNRQTAGKQANRIENGKIENVLRLRPRDTLANIKNVGDHKDGEDRNFRGDQRNHADGSARRQNPFRLRRRLWNRGATQLKSPVSFIFPVRIFRMFQIPKRSTTFDRGNHGKIVVGWWRSRGPLEGPGVPGIVTGQRAPEHGPQKIRDEYKYCGSLKEHADGDEQIPGIPSAAGFIGVDSARHPQHSGNVHQIKGQMKTNQKQPEMPLGQRLVVHPAAHFREPIIERAENREQNCADDHVVKMGHYKVRGAELPIERRRREHDSSQARDQELKQEGHAEKHRSLELNFSAPHGANPVENFDSGGNRDDHRGDGKEGVSIRRHSHGKHMMGPDAEADEADGNRGRDHHRISEYRLARKHRNDFRSEGEARNDQHVNFGMTEYPEEMHPEDGGTSRLRIKKMPAEIAVNAQHGLGGGERRYGKNN